MKAILLLFVAVASALAEETIDKFLSGNKLFTASVYNELVTDNTNLVFSPFSLETVLALTQSGAYDATGEEIRTTLSLPETKEATESVIRGIIPTLQNEKYTLKSANKIYVEKDYSIKEDFKKAAIDIYQADIENVEFLQNVQAAEEINKWVEEETENKIHDLIAPEDLDEYTRLILINALYFQGTWLHPFNSNYTEKMSFFTSEGNQIDTDALLQISVFHNFYESEELNAKFLQLPFQGENATMTFILPNKKDGLANLEKQKERIFMVPQYQNVSVKVSLPKFKIETSIDFSETLQKLGVRKAFDPLEADFSGIAGEKGDLYIEKVKQKTFIDLDENGVAAEAATSVAVPTLSAANKEFVADHPFIFYIKVKDVVLFEGRVVEP